MVEEAETNENVPDEEETEVFLNQNHQPQKGDKILFFSKQRDSWQVITLTSGAIKRFLKSGWYYNFVYQDMEKDGTYLHPGQPYWGFLSSDESIPLDPTNVTSPPDSDKVDNADNPDDTEQINRNGTNTAKDQTIAPEHSTIMQLDGGITPESMSPLTSAKTSPEPTDEENKVLSPRAERYMQREVWKNKLEASKLSKEHRVYSTRSTTSNPVSEEFLDDDYDEQSSICGDTAEEHFYNDLFSRAQNSLIQIEVTQPTLEPYSCMEHQQDMEPSWSCYPLLHPQEKIIPGQKYRLPDIQVIQGNAPPPLQDRQHDLEPQDPCHHLPLRAEQSRSQPRFLHQPVLSLPHEHLQRRLVNDGQSPSLRSRLRRMLETFDVLQIFKKKQ